ncbi:hypothetical protein BJ912DRAFT_475324 [Pholiota molesta]|nr:hypothetical protein BJ912DRAFT_475324 [Pholiota molesta]
MATENGQRYLSDVSNSVVINPTITHVNANVYNGSSPERYGLKLLLENISKGASHDAAERGDPPRCHPQTRTAIRAEIMKWLKAPAAKRKLILWMYGPAGAGKTAIAQSIAEECERQGLLAASFFFGRTVAGRNDASRFVATIAYQLSLSVPELSDHILTAIEKKQTVFALSIATQIQVLIIDPLKMLPTSPRPIFVITDGVDECAPNRSHTALLNALGTAISELRHIPLLFLIASRPEFEIREAFNGDLLNPLVKSLMLDDNFKPDKDIKLYLNDTFKEIHARHLRQGNPLPAAWPAKHNIDFLVSKASGQFIFAATVMRFVESPRHHPLARLDIILGLLAPGNEMPFAPLDALYLLILSSVADLPKLIEIFAVLMFGGASLQSFTVKNIEALLGFTIGTVLLDMHALVFVPPPTDRESALRIHHASLYDFFTDRSRSRNYCIDAKRAHITLSRCWLNVMATYPHIPAPLSLNDCVKGFVHHYNALSARSSEIEATRTCIVQPGMTSSSVSRKTRALGLTYSPGYATSLMPLFLNALNDILEPCRLSSPPS